MKRYGILFVLLAAGLCDPLTAFAQQYRVPILQRSGKQTYQHLPERAVRSYPDTIRVLALMVAFQEDTDSRTTGAGAFIQSPAGLPSIDPAPHDSTYFAYKLQFLQNYFHKSSDGKLIIQGEVWGTPVVLDRPMSDYSPPGDGSDERPLADLVVESWQAADALTPAIPFSSYDAFIIFHAGVGRDIDLVALLGFNPTPDDIPSLYVGLESLRTYLKDPSFAGVPVQNGTFLITHSMILPETETRVLESVGRSDTLLIGMNGLLASTFGSYLGLPDLFDTKTGNSAIGQFGLMDVASIFSFNGMFPPEPSAWEKIYLGWIEPVVVSSELQTVTLPAVGASAVSDTVYKIPINESEYFLIENRIRDPEGNGQRLTLVQDGVVVTKHFGRDTIGFATTNIGALTGSLINVEDFDWSLPGRISENGRADGGGILIWHIDESVISAKFATNEINADPSRRGIALEEADGALDIGQTYGIFDTGLGSEFGSPYDCWYGQNPSALYRNSFDGTTFPNSNSNTGARSGISLTNISERSTRMTATVQIGDALVRRLTPFTRTIGASPVATHPTVTPTGIFVGNGTAVYAFQPNGLSKTNDPTGLLSDKGGERGIAILDFNTGQDFLAGVQDSSVYIWNARDLDGNGVYDSISTTVVPLNQRITTAPSMALVGLVFAVVVAGEKGTVWEISFQGVVQNEYGAFQYPVDVMTQLPTRLILARPTQIYYTSNGSVVSEGVSFPLGEAEAPWLLCSAGSGEDHFLTAARKGGTQVLGVNRDLTARLFDLYTGTDTVTALAAGDIDLDGNKDILVSAGKRLYAVNKAGMVLDGYPVRLLEGSFVGSPLVGDIDNDDKVDVVSLTSGGSIVAYDERGMLKDGFPIQTISGSGHLALFKTFNDQTGMIAVSQSGEMQAWELSAAYNPNLVQWSQALQNALHMNSEQSFIQFPKPKAAEFFPKSLVYNWPNPVYGSTTQIRYYVSENADVTVRIFDLAGLKITELAGKAIGGIDNEMTWNVQGIQSGVYLAHVEVRSGSKTESAVIKIAVIK